MHTFIVVTEDGDQLLCWRYLDEERALKGDDDNGR